MNSFHSTAFVFATFLEAESFLAKTSVNEIVQQPFPVYVCERAGKSPFLTMICGMGLAKASAAVNYLADVFAPLSIINCGVAGSLSDSLAIGEVLEIVEVADASDRDDLSTLRYFTAPEHLGLPLSGHLRSARLLSQAVPLFDPARRALLSTRADLIDMEGAAIAAVCSERDIGCVLLKVVSDRAVERETLLRNLSHTSRRLAGLVSFYLDTLITPESKHARTRARIV